MDKIVWKRGNKDIVWKGTDIIAPDGIYSAVELINQDGFIIITFFDENTPADISNGYIYYSTRGFIPIKIYENGGLVRFLSCYIENNVLVVKGANNFEYLYNQFTLEIIETRYYR